VRGITKTRLAASLLLVPHLFLTALALVLLVHEIGVLDIRGDRKFAIFYATLGAVGGALTCVALWRPGKFSSLGMLSRVRIAAAVWNLLNAAWYSYIILRVDRIDRIQLGEMALAYVTLCALLIFAVEDKK